MMHQLADNKKIFFFLIIFLLISSITSDYFVKLKNNKKIEISVQGLDAKENDLIKEKLKKIENFELFKNRHDIQNIINSNELVDEFEVKIIYPNQINIQIKETTLLAKTLVNNKIFVFGSNKKLIDKYKTEYNHLPTIFGKFDKDYFLDLLSELEKNQFNINQIDSFFFFPSKRWDIKLKNRLLIKLPQKNWKNSIKNVLSILNNAELNNFNVIDLRVNGKVFLK